MADKKGGGSMSIVRIVLYVAVLIILILGMFKIVPSSLTIPVSNVFLIIISIWNGVVYFNEKRKKQAIFIFVVSAILIALLALYFIKL